MKTSIQFINHASVVVSGKAITNFIVRVPSY